MCGQCVFPGTMQEQLGSKLAVHPVYLRKNYMSIDKTNNVFLITKASVMHENKR